MRAFVVCTNPETGQYVVFDPDKPENKVTAYSRESAIGCFAIQYALEVIDIDPDPGKA